MIESSWPLAKAAQRFADRPALAGAPRNYAYREYGAAAARVAAALRASGIGHGDRVAILSLPSTDVPVLLMGCLQLGAVACLLNTRIPRHGLAEQIHRVSGRLLLVDDFFSMVRLGHVPTLRMDDVRSANVREEPPSPEFRLDQAATILFTSGSADEPKAALHTLANHCYNAVASNENIAVSPGDRWLMSLPHYHVSGLGILFRCLFGGGTVVIPESGERLEITLPKFGITHVSLVGTQLFRLLQSAEGVEALKRLKAILVGGSAIPGSLLRQAHDLGLPVHVTYGMTEMASQVTTTPPNASLDTLLTSGRPLRPDCITIAEDGEILVRGVTLFRGYVDRSGVHLPLTPNGWFPTGDLGRFDEQGNLCVAGRKDNLIISGGENVQPEEIEKCLCKLPGVLQAVVVPVDDAEFGARLAAFVRTDDKTHLLPSALSAHLARFLPKYKIPFTFFPWPGEQPDDSLKVNRGLFADLAKRGGSDR